MPADLLLAVDVGTQSVRALLFDRGGERVARAAVVLDPPFTAPSPGAAEQDPFTWWHAVERAVTALWGEADAARVAAMALTTQRGTVVCADATGTPLRLDARDPVVGEWDGARLTRAVAHLVENGVKFGRGHPVEVTVSAEGGDGCVQVRDHGPGVPGDERERIFGKFERAASPDNVGGLGLGLWMARLVAEAHGGTVVVEGGAGDGATFTLRVPRRLPVDG